MCYNKTCHYLNISKNYISNEGAISISNLISHNQTIRVLHFSWNKITGKGALDIATVLTENSNIKVLDASFNSFGTSIGQSEESRQLFYKKVKSAKENDGEDISL